MRFRIFALDAFRPLDAVQPFFNGYRLYLIDSVISPTRKNPDIQIAFIRGSRRERLASLILTYQLFQPVMSNQFGKRAPVRLPCAGFVGWRQCATLWLL